MKFLVRKEARSPYRKGKIIAAQTEDLKPSPRNKRERKNFRKEILKKTKQVRATQISTHQETNSKAHQSTPGHQQNQIATHQFFMKKNKQTNPQRYVYRCSDQQKGAQIFPLAHSALHNKIFIPAGYGKARILQILRIDDLFEPCIVQIPIQRRTPKKTHTHTHTVLPSYQTSCNNKTPRIRRRRRRSRNTKAGTTKETKKKAIGKKKRCSRTQESQREMQHKKREREKKKREREQERARVEER